MKVLSLFDGISVARQALRNIGANVEVYYASETDEYAKAVTQSNFPSTIQVGSVTEVAKMSYDEFVNNNFLTNPYNKKMFLGNNSFVEKREIDLLIGGSPCQDLSIAKKDRKGLSGERSGLFWEYVRILNEVKPKYFVLENVASMPKEAKAVITEALGVEPIMINASLVSAQNRKRLFWTNIPNITQPEDRGILLKDVLEENVDEKYYIKDYKTNWHSDKPVDRDNNKYKVLRVGGDTPTIRIGSLNSGGQGDRIYSQDGKSVSLSANGGGRGAKTGLYAVDTQIRKLTPTECLRLQSMPDNYFDKALYKNKPISNTQRYKMCGNAFNCKVVEHILKYI